jgi:tetratricopeptide (TPR) repeat protein
MNVRNLIIVFLCVIYNLLFLVADAQNKKIDSLLAVLKTAKEDTNKIKALNRLSFSLYTINPDSAILLAQQARELSSKLNWSKGEARGFFNEGLGYYSKADYTKALDCQLKALNIFEKTGDKNGQSSDLRVIGATYQNQANYPKAVDYELKALKMDEEIGSKLGQVSDLSNIGEIYITESDYPEALDYDLKALKLEEEMGDKSGQAISLTAIADVYADQGDNTKALDYDLRALKMDKEMDDKEAESITLNSIANIYRNQKDTDKALDNYLKALKLAEETGDKYGQACYLGNIGNIYYDRGDLPKALEYHFKALKMNDELENKSGQALDMGNMGGIYSKTGKFKEAEDYLKKAIELDSSIGAKDNLKANELLISELYDTTGRYKLALKYYQRAMILRDTLFNAEKNKALTRKEMTFEFDKKQAQQKAEQDTKDAIHNEEVKKQKLVIYSVSGGLLLVLLLAVTIFRSLQQNRKKTEIIIAQKAEVEKKNKEIEEQKALVEEKNKDILDSITYAKRLQDAILPPLSVIEKYLPESFVLYKPKDIVAGDFYWLERVGDSILIAAADCTGHGVPGAMVSVVCSNALNRTVKEFKITEPGKILDKVRELVLETFEKSEANVQDGMDISLCCINTKTHEVQWSGAYNSLCYIDGGELKEIAADKQPIGKTDNPKPFATHAGVGKAGTLLYLFTDGYADQFGGPKGKKFKYKQLSNKLLAISGQSMKEQKHILEETLQSWKGSLEQVDDVLVIGIRV